MRTLLYVAMSQTLRKSQAFHAVLRRNPLPVFDQILLRVSGKAMGPPEPRVPSFKK